jgi:hypothetical protein
VTRSTAWPVLGEVFTVAASGAMFFMGTMAAHAAGWVVAALGTSVFFAIKSYFDLDAGSGRVYFPWIEWTSKLMLVLGLAAAFAHALFMATEWAK